MLIARTGYSGEDGFEVYIPADEPTTVKMWDALLDAGSEFGIRPCGLGARNTLRLEAGMSLYGHEISEEINVFEAGLDRWLKLDKGEFIGREALLAVQAAGGPKRKIVGLEMVDRGIARDGYSVVHDLNGEQIGVVTSGSPAPFLKTNIAMALVPTAVAASRRRRAGRVPRQSRTRQSKSRSRFTSGRRSSSIQVKVATASPASMPSPLSGSVLVLIQFDVCEELRLDKLQQAVNARTMEKPKTKHSVPAYVRYHGRRWWGR